MLTGDAAALHFAGVFLKNNFAVPGPIISTLLARARETAALTGSAPKAGMPNFAHSDEPNKSGATMSGNRATIVIPLEITISVGNPASTSTTPSVNVKMAPSPSGSAALAPTPDADAVDRAVAQARNLLLDRDDVISIDAGYRVADGWITDERCVVVSVKKKLTDSELASRGLTLIPSAISGVPTDVAVGVAADQTSNDLLEALETARARLISNYHKRPDLPLNELDEDMEVKAHASPDAGWPNLKQFLSETKKQLTVGMYEFTAPHIVTACVEAIRPASRHMSLVVQNRDEKKQGTTANDFTEQETVDELTKAAKKRLNFAWASVSGPRRLFAKSYHIKLAVSDSKVFWLSSGSWRSSNQPPFDPIENGDQRPPLLQSYDRDWHVVVSHDGLAKLFEQHLLRDQKEAEAVAEEGVPEVEPEFWIPEAYFRASDEEARVVAPYRRPLQVKRKVRVQPLLTPDNYIDHVLPLIKNARKSVYFQNQSLDAKKHGENDATYEKLLDALLEKQKDPRIDTRIIFRRFVTARKTLTGMQDFGFSTARDKVRMQTNCHTKGIVIDGQIVLLGSQNWTGAGTTLNRDASLIFFDPELAKYYENLFLFDWNRIAQVGIDETIPAAELVRPDEGVPQPGRVKVSAAELLGD
jgi:hypothetical protein